MAVRSSLLVRPLALLLAVGPIIAPVLVGAQGSPSAPPRSVAGADYTFLVRADGSVMGWGNPEESGGLVAPGPAARAPRVVSFPGPVRQIVRLKNAFLALLEDGTIYAWGMNDSGEYGSGAGSSRTPGNPLRSQTLVKTSLPTDLVQLSAASTHVLALRRDGTVLAWGSGPGLDGAQRARAVDGLSDIVKVVAAGDHDLALTRTGQVYAWGENKNGQLGANPSTLTYSRQPVLVAGLPAVVDIGAAGTTNFGFSGAVTADGAVWMWGSDQSATMGDGVFWGNTPDGNDNQFTPKPVKGVVGVKSMTVGEGYVAALLGDHTLRMWGHDGWGQIGIGTNGFYHPLPKKTMITDVAALWSVGHTTYAVKSDGSLWWWGVGSPRNAFVPTRVVLPSP